MNDNTQNELEEIRAQVVQNLTPLMDDASVDPEHRFLLALASARNSGSVDQFRKAFSVTSEIQDQDRRADALLDLLEELDLALDVSDEAPVESQE